jgi:hypothetical protein
LIVVRGRQMFALAYQAMWPSAKHITRCATSQ